METKRCKKCGRDLPVNQFYKDPHSKDGLYGWCIMCKKEYDKAHRYRTRADGQVCGCTPETYYDDRTKGLTPQDLITELRRRGYSGKLKYTVTKIYKITV